MKYWNLSDYTSLLTTNRPLLQQVLFSLALVSLLINFSSHTSISQIGSNPILNQDVDPTYLLFMYLKIPHLISGRAAATFDTLLMLSCIASIFTTRYRIFPILFFLLYFIYFICYNMLSGHHYISVGLVVMSFPFIFSGTERFATAFMLARFAFCFMMFSAACWKIVRGNLWHVDQTNMLLISTYADELIAGKPAPMTMLVRFLLRHRAVSHGLWCLLILIEGVFAAGFLTFTWDKFLLVCYLLFFLGGWILFNIYNFDNLLFLLTLVPVLDCLINHRKHQVA